MKTLWGFFSKGKYEKSQDFKKLFYFLTFSQRIFEITLQCKTICFNYLKFHKTASNVNEKYFWYYSFIQVKTTLFIQNMKVKPMSKISRDVRSRAPVQSCTPSAFGHRSKSHFFFTVWTGHVKGQDRCLLDEYTRVVWVYGTNLSLMGLLQRKGKLYLQ